MTIEFSVPGRPVPKGRPHVTRYGTYTPESTVEYEHRVATYWRLKSGQCFPPKAPLLVSVTAHFEIPKSESKKRRAALVGAPHVSRGDLDNVVKAVLDALNKKAFADDAAVCRIIAEKDYQSEPSTEIVIMEALAPCTEKEILP